MPQSLPSRLERSCRKAETGWICSQSLRPGLGRLEAQFSGQAYDKHRHDFYAIGYTLSGVQSFAYRGNTLNSLPGTCMILHPDEAHDGHAGTNTAFRYRMIYVEPSLIRATLGEKDCALPFARQAVQPNPRLFSILQMVLHDFETPLEPLQADVFLAALTDELIKQSTPIKPGRIGRINRKAVYEAKAFLEASCTRQVTSQEIETLCGLDRFTLARQFRALLGTSPYHYLLSKRLDKAKTLIAAGLPLATIAFDTGFADQSHMTRFFKRTYGMTPTVWQNRTAPLSFVSQTSSHPLKTCD
ncbi:MAG: AraC family transcriptional regulator [Bdellovibrionales bacterium]